MEQRCFAACLQVTHWVNSSIASNPEQAEAVRCIVQGSSGQLPGALQVCTYLSLQQHTVGPPLGPATSVAHALSLPHLHLV